MIYAVNKGSLIIVKNFLLRDDIDVNCQDISISLLLISFKLQQFQNVKLTISLWDFFFIVYYTPLICSIKKKHITIVEELLKHKNVDINIPDIYLITIHL